MANPVDGGRSAFGAGPQGETTGSDVGQTGGQGDADGQPGHGRRRHQVAVEWLLVLVVALVAALLIKTFVVQAFSIPTGSMEPTILPGDRVLVNKLAYDFHAVHDGDVVVFRRPPRDNSTVDDLIKRVIAGPGQWLSVSNCRVYVNGKQEPQPYLPQGWQDPGSEYLARSGTSPACAPAARPIPGPSRHRPISAYGRQQEGLGRLSVLGTGAGQLPCGSGLCSNVAAEQARVPINRHTTGACPKHQ